MGEWAVVHEDVLLDAEIFVVAGLDMQTPDERVVRRHVVRHPGTVAILAVNDLSQVALVRPYRPALEAFRWEVPAGRVEASSEDGLLRDAARELAEEVGVRASTIRVVTAFLNAAGHSDQLTTVCLATDLTSVDRSDQSPEESDMLVEWCDMDEARGRIVRDGPPDAKSLIALQCLLTEMPDK